MEVIYVLKQEDGQIPEGYEVVYTAYITLRNGRRLYASSKGLRAFRILVKKKRSS
jgi:hypothetical protein